MRIQHQSIEVFADYHQFYLWDKGMTPNAPIDYDNEDIIRRIKVGPHVVVVQPARNSTVPVEIEIHDAEPVLDPTGWDHVAEASLHLPTGNLQIHECTGGPVADFLVDPGWYRVRCLHGDLDTVFGTDSEESDRYSVALWPAPPAEVRVVKQWSPKDRT